MFLNSLRNCYDKLTPILGEDIEPYESVELVERYRRYWKPQRVRVLLLAESHVFTSDLDRTIRIPEIQGLNGYPSQYAKFVYCLAYGERRLTGNGSHPRRDGTPQFWKIFHSCNNNVDRNNDFHPILSMTQYRQRIQNKIELLKDLQRRGVWLVDSSVVALYNDGKKPAHKTMLSAIRTSWSEYTGDVVRESDPEHVIVIGKGVANSIESELQKVVGANYSVIAQPNAHLSAQQHMDNFKEYYRLCSAT